MSEILCDCTGPGARINGECAVLRTARLWGTPEGVKQLQSEYQDELRREIARRERMGDGADLPHRLQKLGVPADAILALRAPKETTALQTARRFIGAPREVVRLLVLLGPPGSGKTVAASAVLQDFARRFPWNELATGSSQEPAMLVEARRLTRISEWAAEDSRWLDSMLSAELLVLDDVGDEGTPVGCNALADVVLSRYSRNRRTVITGNVRPEPFAKRYGAQFWDRVRGSGLAPNLWGEKSLRGRLR